MPENNRPVALVTGGRQGIGAGITLALAEAGFNIAFTARSHDKSNADLISRCKELGADVKFFQNDLSDISSHAELISEVSNWGNGLDCLVNNAGVASLKRGDLLDLTLESFDYVMGINLRGTFFLTQAVSKWMEANRSPYYRSIITLSSVSATMASPERGDYCLSKSAIPMLNNLFALRLAELDIGVFEVRPGIIKTAMTDTVSDKYDRLISEGLVPARRWGTPQDLGKVIVPMAMGQLAFATGSVIDADGGLSINRL